MHWEQILIIVKFCKMKAVSELSWNIHSSSRTCGDDSVKGDYPWMYIRELAFFNLIIFYINTQHVGRNEGKMIHVILSFYSNAHFVHIWGSPCQSRISWDVRSHESQLIKILFHPPTINQVIKFPHALVNCCISAQGSKLTDWQVLSLYVVLPSLKMDFKIWIYLRMILSLNKSVFWQLPLFLSIIIYFLMTWEKLSGNSWVHLLTIWAHDNKLVFWTL